MSDIFFFPPIFHSGLSRFKLLFLHTKYVLGNLSRRRYDVIKIRKLFWCNAQIWELEWWFMNFTLITFQLCDFLYWIVSISLFSYQYVGHIENISRIKRCDNLGLSLHFKPSLQSAVSILYVVCILNPICSLQSAFYTDRNLVVNCMTWFIYQSPWYFVTLSVANLIKSCRLTSWFMRRASWFIITASWIT